VKAIAGYFVVALLVLAGGEVCRRAAAFEDALASAQERMATLNPGDALVPEDAARAARWTASLPVVGPLLTADLRRLRALETYWRADYEALEIEEPEGPPADAAVRFITANAMFRGLARRPRDSQALVRGLDAVLKAYFSVLEADPAAVDAAFNYEFVSRLRGSVAAGRGNGLAVPSRPNMNGDKGSPPNQTKPSDFNIIVPLRPEERLEQSDPQGGSTPQRKG